MGIQQKCKQLLLITQGSLFLLTKRASCHLSALLFPICRCWSSDAVVHQGVNVGHHAVVFIFTVVAFAVTVQQQGERQLHQDKVFLHHRPDPSARDHLGFCILQPWTSAHGLLLQLHHPQLLSRSTPNVTRPSDLHSNRLYSSFSTKRQFQQEEQLHGDTSSASTDTITLTLQVLFKWSEEVLPSFWHKRAAFYCSC